MKQEIKFKEGSVQEMGKRAEDTPQAQPPHRYLNPKYERTPNGYRLKKEKGATNGGLMPYILAGTLGLGGGGFGTTLLKPGISPAQLQEHIARIADKIDRTAEKLEDKIEDLEDKIDDLENEINNERRERIGYNPLPEEVHPQPPASNGRFCKYGAC